jgi:hypothetical protein
LGRSGAAQILWEFDRYVPFATAVGERIRGARRNRAHNAEQEKQLTVDLLTATAGAKAALGA